MYLYSFAAARSRSRGPGHQSNLIKTRPDQKGRARIFGAVGI